MTRLTRIKRMLLAGIVAVSMMATSMTAFADTPHAADEKDSQLSLPISQTFVTNGAKVNTDVTYALDAVTEQNNGHTYDTAANLVDGKISYTIDGEGDKNPTTFSIDGSKDRNIVFSWTAPGLYIFDLSMKESPKEQYTYNDASYRVRVYVRNDGNSFVTVEGKDGKVNEVSYTHYYTPPITSNDPPIVKVIDGDKFTGKVSFTFKIVPDSDAEDYPQLKTTEVEVKTDGSDDTYEQEFGAFEFTKAGTFGYTVYEVVGDVKGITYDKAIYHVVYTVKETDTKALESTRVITRLVDNDSFVYDQDMLEFTNTYKKSGGKGDDGEHHDGGGSGSLMVYKVDAASDNIRLAGVTFEVTKTNGDYVTTITTDDKGMAAIDNLPAGTYRLKETNTPAGYQSENRYIYVNVIKGTTVASPTNVKVTNTKAVEVQHIVAIKQWANVDGIDTPDSIVFELYKDGAATGVTQVVSAANNWTVDYGLIPADGNYEIVETSVPENYAVSTQKTVNGTDVVYTITNTYTGAAASHQNAYTGDSSNMMIYAGIMGIAIIALAGWFVVERRSR